MRDLAGLIVIDFIDMESRKNNVAVERRLKDSLKNDRARIQVGTISHFGLMEMSRQRLRPSLAEASLVQCPHCAGMGHTRSPESAALHILRAIEDEGAKFRSAEIAVFLSPEVALYLFNHKRDRLAAIEARYAMRVIFNGDPSMTAANFRIEKLRAQTAPMPAPVTRAPMVDDAPQPEVADVEDEADNETEGDEENATRGAETAEEGQRRRRRRRRGKRRPETGGETTEPVAASAESDAAESPVIEDQPSEIDLVIAAELGEQPEPGTETAEEPVRRRRSRGGRRRKPAGGEGEEQVAAEAPAPAPEPFYADVADIFEAAERAEAEARRIRAEARLSAAPAPTPEAAPEVHVVAHFEPNADVQPVEAAVEPVAPEPLVKPILVGADAPAQEKKRGWWRR
jgi:ribonuclease E